MGFGLRDFVIECVEKINHWPHEADHFLTRGLEYRGIHVHARLSGVPRQTPGVVAIEEGESTELPELVVVLRYRLFLVFAPSSHDGLIWSQHKPAITENIPARVLWRRLADS